MTAALVPMPDGARERDADLTSRLRLLPSLVVAYSGGVDSAFLALRATRILGERAFCVTADSPSYPERHRSMAISVARDFGFRHEMIHTDELERPGYRANAGDRCYYCKHELFARLTEIARLRGIAAVADGTNADDRGDYRPGRRAAREFGVQSPLDAAGLTKANIRALSHEAGLPTWDEPASACLSSRIPHFSEVTETKLRAIEQGEAELRRLGFRVMRVRHHGDSASLEFDRAEMPRALEPVMMATIERALRAIGFLDVTIDPRGYRTGSLNEGLKLRPV